MFFVRVVGMAKIVVHRDGIDDAGDGFGAEGGDPGSHDGMAVWQVAAQLVIECANAVGPSGFGLVMVVSVGIGDAKAKPSPAMLRPTVGPGDGGGFRWWGEEDDGPEGTVGCRGRRHSITQPEGSSTRLRFDGEKTLAASGSPETAA